MTIKRLIGSDPNQISLNRDLGNLAFQNARTENYTQASYGTLTMPASSGTTQYIYHKLEQPVPATGYYAVMFDYTIAAWLYNVTPTAHYSYFKGTVLLTYDGAWYSQKMWENVATNNDYPFSAINAINFYSGLSNTTILDTLRFDMYSNRTGNTPSQAIRILTSVRRIASSDGTNLTSFA